MSTLANFMPHDSLAPPEDTPMLAPRFQNLALLMLKNT
jgi:hypothetical protein